VPVSDLSRQNGHGIGALGAKGEGNQPPASSQASRVEQLLVKEGDRLTAGQTVAILNSRACASVAVDEAEAQVRVTQAKLAQVQAGETRRNWCSTGSDCPS